MVGGVSAATADEPIAVDVISDVVCPWCYIGKRRLEKAIAAVRRAADHPLAARISSIRRSRRRARTAAPIWKAKFGSPDRIRQMHERVAETGAAEGIAFAFDRIAVSPNTLDAHRLIRWAGEAGQAGRVVEALFRAYFIDGRDIGDHAELADIAARVGP